MSKQAIQETPDEQLKTDRDRLMDLPAEGVMQRAFNDRELAVINTEIQRRPLAK